MRIFASWSGEDSRAVAELFHDWLPNVIQGVKVWISSQDIGKGEKWPVQLWGNLSDHDFGLVLVTETNYKSPWILFEAGALSKSVQSRVIPVLCEVDRLTLTGSPLQHLQNVSTSRDEMLGVVEAINSSKDEPLANDRLKRSFDVWWPEFKERYDKIEFKKPSSEPSETKTVDQRLWRIEHAIEGLITTTQQGQRNQVSNYESRGQTFKEYLGSKNRTKQQVYFRADGKSGKLYATKTILQTTKDDDPASEEEEEEVEEN